MKNFKIYNLFFVLILISSSTAFAKKDSKSKVMNHGRESGHHKEHGDHKDHKKHDHSDQEASLEKKGKDLLVIKVKGMVCAFCAQGIKKNFNKQDEVKSTEVNLDNMEVTVQLKKNRTLSEEKIKKIVTDAGFSFSGLKNE